MRVLQSFARTTSIPHWQNAYSPVPIRVQEKFRVSDSGLLMLMFDIAFRLTCRAGIPALTLIGVNLPPASAASRLPHEWYLYPLPWVYWFVFRGSH